MAVLYSFGINFFFHHKNLESMIPKVATGFGRYKDDKRLADRYGNALEYKRACALAYLGRRAQMHGGVCSTRHPHIITQQFIVDLETSNRMQRHARYPWLKALMSLLGEIEQIQDQISTSNVLTLVPAAK